MRLTVLIILICLGLTSAANDSRPTAKKEAKKDRQALVNKHLKEMQMKLELQKQRAKIEAEKARLDALEESSQPSAQNLDQAHDPLIVPEKEHPKDPLSTKQDTLTPAEIISSDVEESREEKLHREEMRRKYIKEIKEKARKAGGKACVYEAAQRKCPSWIAQRN
jgi:hypothetical protein